MNEGKSRWTPGRVWLTPDRALDGVGGDMWWLQREPKPDAVEYLRGDLARGQIDALFQFVLAARDVVQEAIDGDMAESAALHLLRAAISAISTPPDVARRVN